MNRTVSPHMTAQIRRWEGLRTRPYRDSGQWAIGYGHHCKPEWWLTYCMTGSCPVTETQADLWLHTDLIRAQGNVDVVFRDVYMTQPRFDALVAMMFQLGATRFRQFGRMISAIGRGDWLDAGAECVTGKEPNTHSDWFRETPQRCWHVAYMLERSEWPSMVEMSSQIKHTPSADFAADKAGNVQAIETSTITRSRPIALTTDA